MAKSNIKNSAGKGFLLLAVGLLLAPVSKAQVGTNGQDRKEAGRPVTEYNITVEKNKMTLGGVTTKAMTLNGTIPGPVLEFTEGDLAVINVTNKMDVETSIHWHGLILPNYYDGVPYLTTPPIKPGTTFQYRIPINQNGTYWYHSHTMLQEQKGVYGSIIIHPKTQTLKYDKELVVVLSDWTNENPMHISRNLKRGNEWYQVKKGTAVPLSKVLSEGAFGAQLKMWRDRMEGADIADIYYPAFLTNGQATAEYPEFNPGEKVRIRFINASASTYYWMDFGGGMPMIVSADGINVEPVHKNRFLFAIAETYDVIVTLPDGQLEITATVQDGSGHTSLRLGRGPLIGAKIMDKPDKVDMMKQMAKMDMKMGAPAIIGSKKKNTPEFLSNRYGMKMDHSGHHNMDRDSGSEDHMNHSGHHGHSSDTSAEVFDYQKRQSYFNYDFLKAKDATTFDSDLPVQEMLLNLTGNMNRYVWSLNGQPLSENDKIAIKGGEITRITLNNLTMMHHPMHLHGHYFRVINSNGARSPLKHTVNVPPMEKVIIEFYNEEEGDWLFHCHVLYHMMSGMTRVFTYNSPRDERMQAYSKEKLIAENNPYYSWGTAQLGSNFSELELTSSNIRNEFHLSAESDYHGNGAAELTYNRYLNDWVRLYAGLNIETEVPHSQDTFNAVGLAGVKYFTPYMFTLDLSLDHQLRPRIKVEREFLLFPRVFIEGEYEYRADFGWITTLENQGRYIGDSHGTIGASYMVSRNLSIQGNYSSRYGWGGGLNLRF